MLKIGGRALEAPGAHRELAGEVAGLGVRVLIVHGGGADVSDWCARLGHEPRFEDGLRVTDGPTLEIATAVLAGLANKRLVAALRAGGVDAVGLAALDGGMVEAGPHRDAAHLGAVGEVRGVAPALIEGLLAAGRVPVVASIAASDGMLLNLNADDLAAALAVAIGASALVLLSNVPGVALGGGVARRIERAALDLALESPDVRDGMRPKLNAARAALDGGVPRVHIADWSGPGSIGAVLAGDRGTVLTEAAVESLRE